MLFLGFSLKEAQGNSLAILLLPTDIFANVINKDINITDAFVVALIFLGSYSGSKTALSISEQKLKNTWSYVDAAFNTMLFFENNKRF